jgi:hypothetical protein
MLQLSDSVPEGQELFGRQANGAFHFKWTLAKSAQNCVEMVCLYLHLSLK